LTRRQVIVKPPPEKRKVFNLVALKKHAPLYPADKNARESYLARREQRILSPAYIQGIRDFYLGTQPLAYQSNPLVGERDDENEFGLL
jgi:hypothetical protein